MTITEPVTEPAADLVPCKNDDGRPVAEPGGGFGRGTYCNECLVERRNATREANRDRPPSTKRRRRTSRPDAPPVTPRQSRASLTPRLEHLFGTLGMAVFVVNQDDGKAIISGAAQLADALDQLARENPKVRRVLESVLATSAWSGVLVASAAIIMPILANHDLLPSVAAVAPFVSAPGNDWTAPTGPGESYGPGPGGTGASASG